MACTPVNDNDIWQKLLAAAEEMDLPANHLQHLIAEKSRLERFSVKGGGLFYDYSRQRITGDIMVMLSELAHHRRLKEKFAAMMAGVKVNVTENRAALHTACRRFSPDPVWVDGVDVVSELARVREQIRTFSEDIRQGCITGTTGKPLRHVVVVGIGGSYLGTEFIAAALRHAADPRFRLSFLSNVDINNFGQIAGTVDLEETLWVIVSKSYTTAETLANTRQAEVLMRRAGLDPARHMVTITAKGSPGDDPERPVLATFHMFDFIGGRYSVSSAVGGVPLSIVFGYDVFEAVLKGAESMDNHAASAPIRENLPLIAALVTFWNTSLLGYTAMSIVPYAAPLQRLPAHIQQLNMESNGKSARVDGSPLSEAAGPFIFGEPGTNAQHSYFQLAHQGRALPIEFIGVLHPVYAAYSEKSRGVTNHQELWANLIAQPMALAEGNTGAPPARAFSGNRPSSTIVMESLSPENIGRLLSFYEARTVYEAFLWDINPFDQFGVELGKITASGIREQMALKNVDDGHRYAVASPIVAGYLEMLEKGRI
ncbi:MAG: glucose-6-phosphate isomerase [Pseudomonadota bacterium]